MFKRLKKKLEKNLEKRIVRNVMFQSEYLGGVKFVDGKSILHDVTLRNYKCHVNAVDKYKKDNKYQVKCCLQVNNNWCCVHFVNYDIENEVYYDDTIGGDSHHYDYYVFNDNWVMSCIERDKTPSDLLEWAKKDIFNKYATWLDKKLLNAEDVI